MQILHRAWILNLNGIGEYQGVSLMGNYQSCEVHCQKSQYNQNCPILYHEKLKNINLSKNGKNPISFI